jgi:outer membrane protein TolC
LSATRAEGWPTAGFSVNYFQNGYPSQDLSGTQSDIKTVSITVTFTIFDGVSRTTRSRKRTRKPNSVKMS